MHCRRFAYVPALSAVDAYSGADDNGSGAVGVMAVVACFAPTGGPG
jgi:hypothetical protein